jgi:hypothetical protein
MSPDTHNQELENIKAALRTGSAYARNQDALVAHTPAFIPVNPLALDAFTRLLKSVRTPETQSPLWWVKAALRTHGYACVYCGQALEAEDECTPGRPTPAVCDHLIPVAGGGPDLDSGVVPSCVACHVAKSSQDWLTWGKAVDPDALRELRLKIARQAFNHLARDPERVKSAAQVERMLDQRWSHPRGKIYASVTTGGAFVGWRDSTLPLGPEWHWLLVNHGGKALPVERTKGGRFNPQVFTFDQPRQALLSIWALIERNALVRRLDLSPAFSEATPTENAALAQWSFTSPNTGDLVRRRYALPGKWERKAEARRAGMVSREVLKGDPFRA